MIRSTDKAEPRFYAIPTNQLRIHCFLCLQGNGFESVLRGSNFACFSGHVLAAGTIEPVKPSLANKREFVC